MSLDHMDPHAMAEIDQLKDQMRDLADRVAALEAAADTGEAS